MKTAFSFLPRDGRRLVYAIVDSYGYETSVKENMLSALRVCVVRTGEKG